MDRSRIIDADEADDSRAAAGAAHVPPPTAELVEKRGRWLAEREGKLCHNRSLPLELCPFDPPGFEDMHAAAEHYEPGAQLLFLEESRELRKAAQQQPRNTVSTLRFSTNISGCSALASDTSMRVSVTGAFGEDGAIVSTLPSHLSDEDLKDTDVCGAVDDCAYGNILHSMCDAAGRVAAAAGYPAKGASGAARISRAGFHDGGETASMDEIVACAETLEAAALDEEEGKASAAAVADEGEASATPALQSGAAARFFDERALAEVSGGFALRAGAESLRALIGTRQATLTLFCLRS